MEIRHAAVHRLEKRQNQRGANANLSQREITLSEALTRLIQEVLETYSDRCARHAGSFEPEVDRYPFSNRLRKFVRTGEDFYELTVWTMRRLVEKVERETFAVGGYVLFVHYEHSNVEYFMVVQLSRETGRIFSEDMTTVESLAYLNVSGLKVAARVDLTAWQTPDAQRYLTFVLKRQEGAPSAYFRDTVGCRIDQDALVETRKLVTVVEDFIRVEIEAERVQPDRRPALLMLVADYAATCVTNKQPLDLEPLAHAFWPEAPQDFLRFLNAHADAPTTDFIPDPKGLRRLRDIYYRSNSLTFRTSYAFQQAHIRVVDHQVIIEDAPTELVRLLKGED